MIFPFIFQCPSLKSSCMKKLNLKMIPYLCLSKVSPTLRPIVEWVGPIGEWVLHTVES